MKLRLHEQSLRIRLAPEEVEHLRETKSLVQETRLAPEQSLTLTLEIGGDTLSVETKEGWRNLVVRLPKAAAKDWLEGKTEGIEGSAATGGEDLTVIVETDLRP